MFEPLSIEILFVSSLGLFIGIAATFFFFRRSNLAAHRVLNSIPAWACLVNDKMKVLLLNKSGIDFFGGPYFLDSDQGSRLKALLKRFRMANSPAFHVKMKFKGGKSERWFLISLNLLSKSRQVLIVGFDIHDQVIAEDLALEQRAAVESSARMAAVGQVAAGIAHEINNPLAVMTAKAFQVKRRLGDRATEEDLHDLDKIEKTGFRIARIIKGLKSLSRDGEKDPFEPTTVKEILKDVLVMFEEKLRKNQVDLILDTLEKTIFFARTTQIAQILLNLLGNSLDAVKDSKSPWIKISAKVDDLMIEISVTDSGTGLSKDVQEKIMTPFFTTKAAGLGTGLGLSISRRIAIDHGGDLTYNASSPNTQFILRLPRNPAASHQSKPQN